MARARSGQPVRLVLLQGRMIAVQEGPADLLEAPANAFVPAAKSSTGERRLLGRDTEEAPPEPAQYGSHIITRIHLCRRTSRTVGALISKVSDRLGSIVRTHATIGLRCRPHRPYAGTINPAMPNMIHELGSGMLPSTTTTGPAAGTNPPPSMLIW